jgi:hypothetical protein|mmetsp:Transcript_33258/g.87941  ORF Transcript_33258/g.87941 Transcript_33258/m.87941 type:complete len:342 (+) Transcript_33258:470-1495(+)
MCITEITRVVAPMDSIATNFLTRTLLSTVVGGTMAPPGGEGWAPLDRLPRVDPDGIATTVHHGHRNYRHDMYRSSPTLPSRRSPPTPPLRPAVLDAPGVELGHSETPTYTDERPSSDSESKGEVFDPTDELPWQVGPLPKVEFFQQILTRYRRQNANEAATTKALEDYEAELASELPKGSSSYSREVAQPSGFDLKATLATLVIEARRRVDGTGESENGRGDVGTGAATEAEMEIDGTVRDGGGNDDDLGTAGGNPEVESVISEVEGQIWDQQTSSSLLSLIKAESMEKEEDYAEAAALFEEAAQALDCASVPSVGSAAGVAGAASASTTTGVTQSEGAYG